MPRGAQHRVRHRQGRSPVQQNNRLSVRYIFFDNFINDNVGGGLNSVQRGTDFADRQHSTGGAADFDRDADAAQRAARAVRDARAEPRAGSRGGHRVRRSRITNVANFGGPIAGDCGRRVRVHAERVPGQRQPDAHPRRPRLQVRHRHSARGRHAHAARRRSCTPSRTSPPIRPRANGTNRFGYTIVHAVLRRDRPRIQLESLRLLRAGRLAAVVRPEVLYGVRYDLYDVPDADPDAPFEASRDFRVDKNNLAPRVGVVWALGDSRRIGDPRQHRHHVRPDAARDVRAGADQRRHQPPRGGDVPADARLARRRFRPCFEQVPARSRTR